MTRDDDADQQVGAPTLSTAPTGGASPAPAARWWHWDAIPDHLGRARTSTVFLSVLFLAVFALYLNVRPDDVATRTTPAGGGSDVEAPVNPAEPSEPSEEPAPTTGPDETTPPAEETDVPPTGTTPSPTSPSPAEPTTDPTQPPGRSDPDQPTEDTPEQEAPTPTSPTGP